MFIKGDRSKIAIFRGELSNSGSPRFHGRMFSWRDISYAIPCCVPILVKLMELPENGNKVACFECFVKLIVLAVRLLDLSCLLRIICFYRQRFEATTDGKYVESVKLPVVVQRFDPQTHGPIRLVHLPQ
jgi:hypothetical protein